MADTYFYKVVQGTHTRSNKDGSINTFMSGETFESPEADLTERHKNVEKANIDPQQLPGNGPQKERLPSPAGFIPKRAGQEVTSTTVAQAYAAQARETAKPSQGPQSSTPTPAQGELATARETGRETKATTPVSVPGVDTGKGGKGSKD